MGFLSQLLTVHRTLRWHFKGRQLLSLNYPFEPRARWGHGRPPHGELLELIGDGRERYAQTLDGFLDHLEPLRAIAVDSPASPEKPNWRSPWLPMLDAVSLYGMLCLHRPKRYIEIGSGYSTKFARQAMVDHRLGTELISIDPQPRAEIDVLCDDVVRSPLEETDLSLFGRLEAGDVLYMDGSHRCFPNSDVTVFFLDVLPRLAPGVIVQIHDVLLPYDYAPASLRRFYSEQYLLAVHLLARRQAADILMPNAYISQDAELSSRLEPLWAALGLPAAPRDGCGFWMTA
jgi:predicted O-methyltransferase YrrM